MISSNSLNSYELRINVHRRIWKSPERMLAWKKGDVFVTRKVRFRRWKPFNIFHGKFLLGKDVLTWLGNPTISRYRGKIVHTRLVLDRVTAIPCCIDVNFHLLLRARVENLILLRQCAVN